jgi:UDP-glucose 4-epimerase
MSSGQKILVIGGNGYIGSRFVEHLLSLDKDVTAVDNFLRPDDIRAASYPIIDSAYQELDSEFLAPFTDCVWLAGHSSVPQAIADPDGALRNNFFDLIEFQSKFNGRLISASSGSVYSRDRPEECTEESFLAVPLNIYDYTKTGFDLYLASQKIDAVCLRFGTVNGPSPRLRGDLMLNSMVRDGLSKGVITAWNGRVWRPVLFIDVLIRGLDAIIDSDCVSGIFNLCSVNMTVSEYTNAVAHLTGSSIQMMDDTTTYNFIMSAEKFARQFSFEFTNTVYPIITKIMDSIEKGNAGSPSTSR